MENRKKTLLKTNGTQIFTVNITPGLAKKTAFMMHIDS